MMNPSDLEELLEEREASRKWSFPARVFVILGVVALAALFVLGVSFRGRGLSVETESDAFVSLRKKHHNHETCWEKGMYYGHPHKLPGTERTVEWNAFQCQQRCQVVDGCAHFSFWPHDGGCLLTGEESTLKAAPDGKPPKTGPKFCPSAVDAAQEAIAQVPDNDPSTGLPATDVVSSGIPQAESAWASSDSKDTSDVTAVVPPAGVNGTSCSKYPACVDVGITEGDCCPNAAAVTLGCCNGFPKAVEEVKIAKGSECSKLLGV